MTNRQLPPSVEPVMDLGLADWIRTNPIGDEMSYKAAASDQFYFVTRGVYEILAQGLAEIPPETFARVIGTHTSKSIKLPVYQFKRADLGVTFFMRGNFHDWKLSVHSDKEIHVNLAGLCHTGPPPEPDYSGDELSPVYFEGFPSKYIYRYYDQSNRKWWSGHFNNDQRLWTALFIVMRSIGAVKPLAWSTRPRETRPLGRK